MDTTPRVKTIVRNFAVLDKPIKQMGEMSFWERAVGEEFRLGTGDWYVGTDGALHHRRGVFASIPAGYFHLEREEETQITTKIRGRI